MLVFLSIVSETTSADELYGVMREAVNPLLSAAYSVETSKLDMPPAGAVEKIDPKCPVNNLLLPVETTRECVYLSMGSLDDDVPEYQSSEEDIEEEARTEKHDVEQIDFTGTAISQAVAEASSIRSIIETSFEHDEPVLFLHNETYRFRIDLLHTRPHSHFMNHQT
jgi:hypothetical protein